MSDLSGSMNFKSNLTNLQVAMKDFVDNFSVLAVESCVVGDLANCLSPEKVMKLDDALISSIAAETEDSQIERRRATEKLRTLNEGMLTLGRFSRWRFAGQLWQLLN